MIEGLGGRADASKSGTVTVKELEPYVAERVKALTKGGQTPTFQLSGMPDFPLAAVK